MSKFNALNSYEKIIAAASKAREYFPELKSDDFWTIPADENLETASCRRISSLLAVNAMSRLCLQNKDRWDNRDRASLANFDKQEERLVAALRVAMARGC